MGCHGPKAGVPAAMPSRGGHIVDGGIAGGICVPEKAAGNDGNIGVSDDEAGNDV